jgi:hypothetical protein
VTTGGEIDWWSISNRAGGLISSGRIAPDPVGQPVGAGVGAAACTTAVAFEAAVALPVAFLAVTRTLIRRPTALAVTTYDRVVAPPIAAQSDASGFPPDWGQRVH